MTAAMADTVLVTGGSGFLGSHVILAALAGGYDVRTTVRSLAREGEVRAMIARGTKALSGGEPREQPVERPRQWLPLLQGEELGVEEGQPPREPETAVREDMDGVSLDPPPWEEVAEGRRVGVERRDTIVRPGGHPRPQRPGAGGAGRAGRAGPPDGPTPPEAGGRAPHSSICSADSTISVRKSK